MQNVAIMKAVKRDFQVPNVQLTSEEHDSLEFAPTLIFYISLTVLFNGSKTTSEPLAETLI
jgi:hypothetical protein